MKIGKKNSSRVLAVSLCTTNCAISESITPMTIRLTPIPLRALLVLDARVMVTPVMFAQPPMPIQGRKPSLESPKSSPRRLIPHALPGKPRRRLLSLCGSNWFAVLTEIGHRLVALLVVLCLPAIVTIPFG